MTTVYTVGHSTRGADEFRELLASRGIERLVDIRKFPASRRFPHFNAQPLAKWLAGAGIEYRHEVALGGRRRGGPDSINAYWRNASFRAFADYMASDSFSEALDRLVALAAERPTAIMCAEAVPWRCHRWLVADALTARGAEVVHLLDAEHAEPHVLNPAARVDEHGRLTYPTVDTPNAGRAVGRVQPLDALHQTRLAFDPRDRHHTED